MGIVLLNLLGLVFYSASMIASADRQMYSRISTSVVPTGCQSYPPRYYRDVISCAIWCKQHSCNLFSYTNDECTTCSGHMMVMANSPTLSNIITYYAGNCKFHQTPTYYNCFYETSLLISSSIVRKLRPLGMREFHGANLVFEIWSKLTYPGIYVQELQRI